MAEQVHTQIGNGENQYATPEDFRRILNEDLNLLYQLSFLLTTDHQKAERCLVESIEDCANENGVFREFARPWTKRVVVVNAIRELKPRPIRSNSSLLPSIGNQWRSDPTGHFTADALQGACGLRPLCVRTVRSRALPGKRPCPSSRLLSFLSSGSLDSRNRDIVQYRPGGCSCKFRSPIRDLANFLVTPQKFQLILDLPCPLVRIVQRFRYEFI